jgi:futalosine hydrolase
MNCLVVAATAVEIAPFLDYYRNSKNLRTKKIEIDILITGIGLTASTYSLTRQLQLKRPDLVIQAGIAGSFRRDLQLGTVFAVAADLIADQGVIENDGLKTLFDMGLTRQNQKPYSGGWLKNSSAGLMKKSRLKRVKGISVNHITSSKKMIDLYKKKFNAATESMEGAALHFVCLSEKVPFIQLRALSNYIGERNKKKWMLKQSIINLNDALIGFLESMKK